MKAIVLAASALMLACFIPTAPAAAAEKAWFVPELTAGDPSECAPLLAGARKVFTGEDKDYYPAPLGTEVPGLDIVPYDVEDKGTKPAAIKAYTLKMETVIGCGMACDTGTITVLANGKAVFTTPEANPWAEYTNGKDRDYLVAIIERHAEAYRVADSGKPALACRIAMEPDFQNLTDSDVLAALKAVDNLNKASLSMSRAGGFCGSMGTPGRWETKVEESLHQAVYRPWALTARGDASSENSYGDYDRIVTQLKLWSLSGLSEYTALQQFKDRIVATETILASFYTRRFGWQPAKAKSQAHSALINAISSGFGFYLYKPFKNAEEGRLRAAIFARAPMAEIQAISLEVKLLDPVFAPDYMNKGMDSILNIAITYPQALQYLLDKGFDPNRTNSFGKTPLMYAAQYNQLEAARILLKAGADPNARTTNPPEDCGFSLTTTSMTPLHYAVRSAGTSLIRLLLQSGAVSFIKAHDERKEGREGPPLTWLHLYTSGAPDKEKNPNLSPQEAAALEKDLSLDPATLAKIASTNVLIAEKQTASGNNEAAYQAISIALQADPGNQKGLADLPLLALKTQRTAEAAWAATRATTALKADAGKASAWFNLGLVCESATNTDRLTYDGKTYCQGNDRIYPFLRAWQITPTDSQVRKLTQLMGASSMPENKHSCDLDGRFYRMLSRYENHDFMARVYVLHHNGETIDPKSITWTMNWADKPETLESPHPAGRFVLGEQILTVLESAIYSSTFAINGQACGTD